MRISDWSSDVCSSDLALDAQLVVAHGVGLVGGPGRVLGEVAGGRRAVGAAAAVAFGHGGVELVVGAEEPRHVALEQRAGVALVAVRQRAVDDRRPQPGGLLHAGLGRSEEHTSELQSLMRISSAVFCLQKKTK